jgi:cytoskeletal protein CcmA (bactofilin family)
MANERQACYLPPVPPGPDNPDAAAGALESGPPADQPTGQGPIQAGVQPAGSPIGSPSGPAAGQSEASGGTTGDVERYADALVELNALLGRGTHYSGKLHFEGRVRIEGSFDGEIRGEDVLVIGQGADVAGTIEVGVCIVTGGNVRADIRARDAIELHAPGRVKGDLHAPNIFIDRGVQFEGNCKMAPLDEATDEAADVPPERTTNPGPPPSTPNGEAAAADAATEPIEQTET